MNNKVDLLIDEPCPELLCGICLDILNDPIQVHCPEDHMFCSDCIKAHQHSHCPLCSTELDKNSFQLSKFVQRQIDRLRIKCLYSDSGCSWTGVLSDTHVSNCDYQTTQCPNADKGCDKKINQHNIEDHLKLCLYQFVTCPNNMPLCQPFLLKDLSLHEAECQSYTCPYASEGCPFIGTQSQANIHCGNYCGKLHQKVTDLENEIKRLNTLITMSLAKPTLSEASQKTELDLFQQIFHDDPFLSLDDNSPNTPILTTSPSPVGLISSPVSSTPIMKDASNATMIDLTSCLTDISFLNDDKSPIPPMAEDGFDFDALFKSVTSPEPLQFVPPLNAPKRTSNGKKIRYSKNKRLAHSAIRIGRERANPTNDAILNNLEKQKQQLAFKSIEEVTHFLHIDSTKPSSPKAKTASSHINKQFKKEKKKSISSSPSSSTPKRRPMFVLASSYLSNYNTDKV